MYLKRPHGDLHLTSSFDRRRIPSLAYLSFLQIPSQPILKGCNLLLDSSPLTQHSTLEFSSRQSDCELFTQLSDWGSRHLSSSKRNVFAKTLSCTTTTHSTFFWTLSSRCQSMCLFFCSSCPFTWTFLYGHFWTKKNFGTIVSKIFLVHLPFWKMTPIACVALRWEVSWRFDCPKQPACICHMPSGCEHNQRNRFLLWIEHGPNHNP